PGTSTIERIYFSYPFYGSPLDFQAADLPKNSCKIDWRPELTQDGIYTFEVEAADISNNESGKYNYKISFEVVNRSTITEVLNYPNPFSTSTRFVFTLTGNEVPTDMKIQIMTVSGKIVREITSKELGDIHIGRNITEYAWDGKDEFGDRLANGLYLYRVITRMGDRDIEKKATEADAYFKKGWGKMYILR
ncbi:MAG: transporter, partial [Bacteroidota bacterium]